VQVYAALLLTLLAAHDPSQRLRLHALLPAAGRNQLSEVVERFLRFDEQVGVISGSGKWPIKRHLRTKP
jgi:hypothetical protein